MADADDALDIPLARVAWRPSYRLIPSRFPVVGLYDAVADPADLDVVFAVEALANPRLRDEAGDIALVPKEERLTGPGATPVMAAFTHLNPEGSRFSDGTWGVYYAAHTLATAVAEVGHHRAVFMRRTQEQPLDLDYRCIAANVEAELHDLGRAGEAPRAEHRALLDPDSYAASQRVAAGLRASGSHGLRYPSVRDPRGECVAIFRPRALRHARAVAHVALHWNGERVSHWYGKDAPRLVTVRR